MTELNNVLMAELDTFCMPSSMFRSITIENAESDAESMRRQHVVLLFGSGFSMESAIWRSDIAQVPLVLDHHRVSNANLIHLYFAQHLRYLIL